MKLGEGGMEERVEEATGLGHSRAEYSSCMGDLDKIPWSPRKYRWAVGDRRGSRANCCEACSRGVASTAVISSLRKRTGSFLVAGVTRARMDGRARGRGKG